MRVGVFIERAETGHRKEKVDVDLDGLKDVPENESDSVFSNEDTRCDVFCDNRTGGGDECIEMAGDHCFGDIWIS